MLAARDSRLPPIFPAVFFGLLAAMGYALQHPFSKPIATRFSGSPFDYLWLVVLSQITSLLVGAMLLCLRPSLLGEVVALYKSPSGIKKASIISLIGVVDLGIYLYAISIANPVLLSIILNLYPIWSLLIGFLLRENDQEIDPGIVFIFAIGCIGIIHLGSRDGHIRHAPIVYALIFSLIPILYALSFWLRRRFFRAYSIGSYVVATQVFDAPIIIATCLLICYFAPPHHRFVDTFTGDGALYVVGSLSTFCALYCLHKGSESKSKGWIPSFMLFLVPAFVALFSFIMTKFSRFDLKFDRSYIWLILVLSILFAGREYVIRRKL